MNKSVTRVCKQCNGEFTMNSRRRTVKREFCSISCGAKHSRAVMYKDSRVKLSCASCAVEFETNKYSATVGKKRFCSRSCADKSKIISVPKFICAQCSVESNRRKNTGNGGYDYTQKYCSVSCQRKSLNKGGSLDKNGYRIIHINGRVLPEHRYVMEGIIGRFLLPEETVHHKNGIRTDNRPENLELFSSRHCKGQRITDKLAWCYEFIREYEPIVGIITETENKVVELHSLSTALGKAKNVSQILTETIKLIA